MTHAALSLQEAIYDALSASQSITAIIGENRIFDDVPSKTRPPYILFGDATHTDWSTDTGDGLEHFVRLDIWSKRQGRKQALEISELVLASLKSLPEIVAGHTLINFRHEFTEVGHDPDTELFLARMNFRAVTEPAAPTN